VREEQYVSYARRRSFVAKGIAGGANGEMIGLDIGFFTAALPEQVRDHSDAGQVAACGEAHLAFAGVFTQAIPSITLRAGLIVTSQTAQGFGRRL